MVKYVRRSLIFSSMLMAVVVGVLFFALYPTFKSVPEASQPRSDSRPSGSSVAAPTQDAPLSRLSSSKHRMATTAQPVAAPAEEVAVRPDATSPTITTSDGKTYPLRTYKPLAAPNDPYANQWWITSTGLEPAWTIGAGARATTVAVIDTGFGLQHEEFASRWATNGGEQGVAASEAASQLNCTDRSLPLDASCNLIDDDYDAIVDNESGTVVQENSSQYNCTDRSLPLDKSCNRIDDDGNGYVDDVTGFDFASYDSSVQAGEINPVGLGTWHGTAVAGVLAATGNNGKGIAGVDWSAKILPLQAIDDDEYGNTLTVARAIYYAVERGADVISMSLGAEEEDPYLRQAVQHALDQGIVVVAASGNDGCNCISYPARYPEVLAVGAQSPDGSPAPFSSYGSSLDILAPGEGMTSASWTQGAPTNAYVSGIGGTSFATPYVSGLLSLARSHQPDATWGELTNALLMSANHTSLTGANPTSSTLGSGYARASPLLSRVTTPASPGMRYQFGPLGSVGSTLGSSRVHTCNETGNFPTALLYEVAEGTTSYYTLDTLEYVRALGRGDAATPLWRACVGLPGDTPTTVRTINLFGEIKNQPALRPRS